MNSCGSGAERNRFVSPLESRESSLCSQVLTWALWAQGKPLQSRVRGNKGAWVGGPGTNLVTEEPSHLEGGLSGALRV